MRSSPSRTPNPTRPPRRGVRVLRPRAAGEYVREAGSDLAAGDDVLPPGLRLAPRHLAAAAASGLTELLVRERVRVAVVSTGSELVPPGSPLGAGEIPDANGVALAAAVRAAGAVVVHEAQGARRGGPPARGAGCRARRRRRTGDHERRRLDGRLRGGARDPRAARAGGSAASRCSPAARRRPGRTAACR